MGYLGLFLGGREIGTKLHCSFFRLRNYLVRDLLGETFIKYSLNRLILEKRKRKQVKVEVRNKVKIDNLIET